MSEHTAPSHVLYISPDGDDASSGLSADRDTASHHGPLATLQRARDMARDLIAGGASSVVVYLRGGRYPLTSPILFTPADCGPLTFANYPGETPILDGGVQITGWSESQVNGVGVWVADVADFLKAHPRHPRSLFVNDQRCPRTTLPHRGSFAIEDVPDNTRDAQLFQGVCRFVTAQGDMQSWHNLQDIDALVHHYWVEERMPITSWEPRSRVLNSSHRSVFCLRAAFGPEWASYQLENVFEALSRPGEWYLDRQAAKIYYVPKAGERLDELHAIIPVTTCLLTIQGDPIAATHIHSLTFRGLSFLHTDWDQPGGTVPDHNRCDVLNDLPLASDAQAAISCPGSIDLSYATNITFEECHIAHTGGYGIHAGPACRNLKLIGNHLYDLGGGGIKLVGAPAGKPPALHSGHHLVTDNHIHHTGEVFKSGIAIVATHICHTEISHNHIHHTHYSGISLGWVWGYADNAAHHNLISYNHIHHVGGGVLSDMGGIYTLGVQPGTVITHNVIHDVAALHYGGWGIYLDEGSSHIIVENNVVYKIAGECFNVHYGRENTVRNNILIGHSHPLVCLGKAESHIAFTLTNNILATGGAALFTEGYAGTLSQPQFRSDVNLLHVKPPEQTPFGQQPAYRSGLRYNFDQLRSSGLEAHSTMGDPDFVTGTPHPCVVSPMSPARSIGFIDIDLSILGPRPPSARRPSARLPNKA